MITHDAYYAGTHWLREGTSPEMQERGICKHCDVPETMEHILSQCEAPGQKEIWELAKELWLKGNPDWAWPGIGTIIISGLATFKNGEGKVKAGRCKAVQTNNGRVSIPYLEAPMFEKKEIPIKKVLQTWKEILKGEDKLPDHWPGSAEVLVGIEPRQQPEE
ncbi:hypothetical protein B0H14DRAFT_2560741 [Mycena olivaceomarginata]|nr:hypothetical protein B0H14DRAFT_2560741 [Mycena olivaceomarginata]